MHRLPITSKKIAFLGVGNMGSALIQGALKSGFIRAGSIKAYDINRKVLTHLKRKTGIKPVVSAQDAVRGSDFVFICVKPQQMDGLLSEVRDQVLTGQCLVSIAAGVTTRRIEKRVSRRVPLVRVMPNTPAMVGSGVSVVARGRFAGGSHVRFVLRFFESVGKALVLPEKYFDAVTAVSGSGPAYLFYLAESLQRACRKLGLPGPATEVLYQQTLLGAGIMLSGNESPMELRRKVTSPGGTTEAAIRYLEKKKWADVFVQAVKEASKRSKKLSQ